MLSRTRKTAWVCVLGLMLSVCSFLQPGEAQAEVGEKKERVIVSLGDSYSAGEGVEPFFGQDRPVKEKAEDPKGDWLAHRSELAWSGLLKLDEVGYMYNNRDTNWFFVAASGAKTINYYEPQPKGYKKKVDSDGYSIDASKPIEALFAKTEEDSKDLPAQNKVWDTLKAKNLTADYVTLTFGGNDLGFTNVVSALLLESRANAHTILYSMILSAYNKMKPGGEVRERLKKLYRDIAIDTERKAKIIVVGYPPLFYEEGWLDAFVNPEEAIMLNMAIRYFNTQAEKITVELRTEGYEVYFVSVYDVFRGNEAYSSDPYINPAIIPARTQDIDDFFPVSSYSIHPNIKGILVYACLVQKKINELEKERKSEGDSIDYNDADNNKTTEESNGKEEIENEVNVDDLPISKDTYNMLVDMLPYMPKYNRYDSDTGQITHPGVKASDDLDGWLLATVCPSLSDGVDAICKGEEGGNLIYNVQDVCDMSNILTKNDRIEPYYVKQLAILSSRGEFDDEEIPGFTEYYEKDDQLFCRKLEGDRPYVKVESVGIYPDELVINYMYSEGAEASEEPWEAHYSVDGENVHFLYTMYRGGNSTEGNTGNVYSLYADAMQEYLNTELTDDRGESVRSRGYALRDINQDGIDDLILVAGEEWHGYDLLRLYTVKDGELYQLIEDDDGRSEKYAFSGNKIHLWNTMLGSGIKGEAAFTFDPGKTKLTLVKAISMNASNMSNVICYEVTDCEDDNYFYFGDEPGPDFNGKVISEKEYDRGIDGYSFTDLDFEPDELMQDAIETVRRKGQ